MNYPLLDAFWTMLWFFLWIMWLFLLFRIIGDIFRDHDSSGWVKAGWVILVIILPFLGVLVYVIVHGSDMGKRDIAQAQQAEAAFQERVRQAAQTSGTSQADELAKLAALRENGTLSEAEFQQAKTKILA
jgi:hypothetical protein